MSVQKTFSKGRKGGQQADNGDSLAINVFARFGETLSQIGQPWGALVFNIIIIHDDYSWRAPDPDMELNRSRCSGPSVDMGLLTTTNPRESSGVDKCAPSPSYAAPCVPIHP